MESPTGTAGGVRFRLRGRRSEAEIRSGLTHHGGQGVLEFLALLDQQLELGRGRVELRLLHARTSSPDTRAQVMAVGDEFERTALQNRCSERTTSISVSSSLTRK